MTSFTRDLRLLIVDSSRFWIVFFLNDLFDIWDFLAEDSGDSWWNWDMWIVDRDRFFSVRLKTWFVPFRLCLTLCRLDPVQWTNEQPLRCNPFLWHMNEVRFRPACSSLRFHSFHIFHWFQNGKCKGKYTGRPYMRNDMWENHRCQFSRDFPYRSM